MAFDLTELAPEHHAEVMGIFNHYVMHSLAAYPEQPLPVEAIRKMAFPGYPILVALTPEKRVAGFGMLRPWHPMPTFRQTAEISYFIAPEHTGRGLGKMFFERLRERAEGMGITQLLASISSANDASLAFHRKQGFVECGRFREVGLKHGQRFDVVWMQKKV